MIPRGVIIQVLYLLCYVHISITFCIMDYIEAWKNISQALLRKLTTSKDLNA